MLRNLPEAMPEGSWSNTNELTNVQREEKQYADF